MYNANPNDYIFSNVNHVSWNNIKVNDVVDIYYVVKKFGHKSSYAIEQVVLVTNINDRHITIMDIDGSKAKISKNDIIEIGVSKQYDKHLFDDETSQQYTNKYTNAIAFDAINKLEKAKMQGLSVQQQFIKCIDNGNMLGWKLLSNGDVDKSIKYYDDIVNAKIAYIQEYYSNFGDNRKKESIFRKYLLLNDTNVRLIVDYQSNEHGFDENLGYDITLIHNQKNMHYRNLLSIRFY